MYGPQTLTCKNLQEYLKSLSKDTLDRLYNHPATCLAVFRSEAYVIRLLLRERQRIPRGKNAERYFRVIRW
ncbi:General transcription factor IIH subunit 4 [Portunus trituberculatus]|uniref:General transcription factor IIH subunit 4 n=1 Tax=Portunus trituberculatus TaxID=210409 RepID=A0A5B7JDJ9_PORTR|nr:General transcription factor IIH subunit 4 [Portunus trituberculatus]